MSHAHVSPDLLIGPNVKVLSTNTLSLLSSFLPPRTPPPPPHERWAGRRTSRAARSSRCGLCLPPRYLSHRTCSRHPLTPSRHGVRTPATELTPGNTEVIAVSQDPLGLPGHRLDGGDIAYPCGGGQFPGELFGVEVFSRPRAPRLCLRGVLCSLVSSLASLPGPAVPPIGSHAALRAGGGGRDCVRRRWRARRIRVRFGRQQPRRCLPERPGQGAAVSDVLRCRLSNCCVYALGDVRRAEPAMEHRQQRTRGQCVLGQVPRRLRLCWAGCAFHIA
jgi:hypothetical protein